MFIRLNLHSGHCHSGLGRKKLAACRHHIKQILICDGVWPPWIRWLLMSSWQKETNLNYVSVNSLRPSQNGRHFADDIFKCIFLNEIYEFRLRFHRNLFLWFELILFQHWFTEILAWRRPADKPLSEPMMVNLLTHICVIRPQWIKLTSLIGPWDMWK